MVLKYRLIERRNPQKKDEPAKWFAVPVYNGQVDIDFLAREIAKRSSLTVGDIKNVIENFFDILPTFMLLGFTIKIDGLGTFRISFSSEGAETEDTKVTPDKMRSIRILFRPDADLRARILQEMEYERVTEGEVTVDPDDENDEEIEDGPVVQ